MNGGTERYLDICIQLSICIHSNVEFLLIRQMFIYSDAYIIQQVTMMKTETRSKGRFQDVDVPKYFVCSRCSYHWKPRKDDGIPRNCPSCRSTVWMKPFELKTCSRCGYEWGSTSEDPRRCPSCGTYRWNEIPTTYSCLRCEHSWTAKRDWPPKRCPKCRSVAWNTEKREQSRNDFHIDAKKSSQSVTNQELVKIITVEYRKGKSCTMIAVDNGIPFSIVYTAVRDEYPLVKIKV